MLKETYSYTGSEIKPQLLEMKLWGKNLVPGTDYNLSYENNIQAGYARIKITGTGDYTGEKSVDFIILPEIMAAPTVRHLGGGTVECSWDMLDYVDGYTIEYVYKGNWRSTLTVNNRSTTKCLITNIAFEDLNYVFRIKAYKNTSKKLENDWSEESRITVKGLRVFPKDEYRFAEVTDLDCLIDLNCQFTRVTGHGYAKLYTAMGYLVEKVEITDDMLANGVLKIPFNYISNRNVTKNTRYNVAIDSNVIELLDENSEPYEQPVFFEGLSSNEWNFRTAPEYYLDVLNPNGKTIPEEYYKKVLGKWPGMLKRKFDDGSAGWCFGICYTSMALNRQYSTVSSAYNTTANKLTLDSIGSSGAPVQDYIQVVQVSAYLPEMEDQLKAHITYPGGDYSQIQGMVEDLQKSDHHGYIIKVQKSKSGGHALYPLGIIEHDNEHIRVAVYDCRRPENDEEKGLKTYVQPLDFLLENGKICGYSYRNGEYSYGISFYKVDQGLDQKIGTVLKGGQVKNDAVLLGSTEEMDGLVESTFINS